MDRDSIFLPEQNSGPIATFRYNQNSLSPLRVGSINFGAGILATFSQSTRQSGASFLVSLGIHFGLLLTLSFFLLNPNVQQAIFLDSEPSDRVDDLETQVTLQLDFPLQQESVSLDANELSETIDESLKVDSDELLDFSALDSEFGNSAEGLGISEEIQGQSKSKGAPGFFGIQATGNRIVYIIDMSPSMQEGNYRTRFSRAVKEVLQSVDQLRPDQEFYVYLFCFRKLEMNIGQSRNEFVAPTKQNKNRLRKWLDSVRLGPGTDPRETLVAALKKEPTCVFLLSDGEFNGVRYRSGKYRNRVTTVELARRYNQTKCPIHTIGLENEDNQADMTMIANESGGVYRFVPAEF
jgi:hypothetical protein